MRMPFSPFLTLRPSWFHCVQPSNAGCVRLLPCNLQNVAEAVVVKTAHRVEVGGEGVGVSGLQLLDEALTLAAMTSFAVCGLLRLLVGCVVVGGGCAVHGCFLLGLLGFCTSALKRGMYHMPNASWRRRG